MILEISTYFMAYFLEPLMSTFLTDPPCRILAWAWFMSSSQVITHFTLCIQPTGPPHNTQTPYPTDTSICIVASLGPPMKSYHIAPSANPKVEHLP